MRAMILFADHLEIDLRFALAPYRFFDFELRNATIDANGDGRRHAGKYVYMRVDKSIYSFVKAAPPLGVCEALSIETERHRRVIGQFLDISVYAPTFDVNLPAPN